jgi:hypothetical protein
LNDQAWYWTPEWYEGQRRALAQADAGEVDRSMDEDEFIASL